MWWLKLRKWLGKVRGSPRLSHNAHKYLGSSVGSDGNNSRINSRPTNGMKIESNVAWIRAKTFATSSSIPGGIGSPDIIDGTPTLSPAI